MDSSTPAPPVTGRVTPVDLDGGTALADGACGMGRGY